MSCVDTTPPTKNTPKTKPAVDEKPFDLFSCRNSFSTSAIASEIAISSFQPSYIS
jgi:hypothetical protein